MAKAPEERYASAEAMRRELQAAARELSESDTAVLPVVSAERTARTTVIPAVPRRTGRRRPVWALIVATLAVALLAAWASGALDGDPVIVPQVVGMPIEQARNALTDEGLEVGLVEEVHDAAVPAGVVISQDPAEGSVDAGSAVALQVSLGPRMVAVPDVRTLGRDEAFAALEEAGLVAAEADAEYSAQAAGTVLRQEPAPGEQVAEGSSVALALSLGPAPPASNGQADSKDKDTNRGRSEDKRRDN